MIAKIKSKVRNVILRMSGKYPHLKKSVKCARKWYGNAYGGFYLNPGLLNENSIVYSFGIGEDISFDDEVIKNHGCKVFGFDPTPKSINWINARQLPEKFKFYDFGISSKSGFTDLYLPRNPEHVSGSIVNQKNIDLIRKVSVEMKSLGDIVNKLGHVQIDVLKMDIEGAEYEVIEDILKTDIPITQILIEFHDRFVENGNMKSRQAVENLERHGYKIFAVSDSFEEISFIHKNSCQSSASVIK